MLKSGSTLSYESQIRNIVDSLPSHVKHLSVELVSCVGRDLNAERLINEAKILHDISDDIVIKVPMYSNGVGLEVITRLEYQSQIFTNATCLMSFSQAILAINSGATYISLFYNRMKDYYKSRLDPFNTVAKKLNAKKIDSKLEAQIKNTKIDIVTDKSAAEYAFQHIKWTRDYIGGCNGINLICGSIRDPRDVADCLIAGANIVTVPYDIMKKLLLHPKTDEAISEFDKAYQDYCRRQGAA
jgi:transaldolase